MATFVTYDKLSKIMDAIKTRLAKKLDASGIKNDASTTDSGYVLDARMGKTLGDRATTLETKVGDLYFDTDSSGNWGFKSSKNGAVKSFTATGAASTIESSNLAVSKALVSDANGKVAAAETTAAELGFLHGVTSAVQEQIGTLNSNLANVSNTVSGHTSSINSLNSANSSRYAENGRINVYVGSDSKLHFVNRDGADTALNFSGTWVPIWIVSAETSYWGVESNPIKRSFANAYSEVILCLTWTRTRVLSVSGATIESYTGVSAEASAASNLDIMLLKNVQVGATVTYGAAHNDGDGADILVAFGRRK